MVMKQGACPQCAKAFRGRRRKFCSAQCAHRARRRALDVFGYLASPERSLDRTHGYVMVYCPGHPRANNRGYASEHRLLMELHLRRSLSKDEHVHHRNGKRWDNRLENLEVLQRSDHAKLGYIPAGVDPSLVAVGARPKKRMKRAGSRCACGQAVIFPRKYCSRRCLSGAREKARWPTRDQLAALVKTTPTARIARLLGVSDKAVSKACRRMGLQTKPRGFWTKVRALASG
jgi:hypothetical protein